MKYLPAASAEVATILNLLKVCQANGDKVETDTVQKHYRNIGKIYAKNAQRTSLASQANLVALLDALNVKVKACELHTREVKADALASQYAGAVKLAIAEIEVEVGSATDEGLELE